MSSGKLNPVAWMEGMFLRPHHLQQQDLAADARLHYHLRAIDPFHWGVRELVIDEEALGEGRVVILRLEAVMRDGTIVRHPGNAVVETRQFDPKREKVEVFLGLRQRSISDPNAGPQGVAARNARWVVQQEESPDWNRGGNESAVDVLAPNVRVLLSGEETELELYESFKLAEIVATDDSKQPFALSRSFVPPLLSVQASPVLSEEMTRIVNQVAARVRVAAGQTQTFSVQSTPVLWMRYTLARSAPLLRHLASTGETHPFPLYTTLVEIAGGLGAFHLEDAAELPLYDHENLALCYRELIAFISDKLDRITPINFHKLPMAYEAPVQAYVTKALNVQLVDPRNAFYLAIKAPIDGGLLAEQVVSQGIASSVKGVGSLIKFAIPGLRLEKLPGAPTEIEAMAGFQYFKVDPHHREWTKVRDEFSCALHLGKLQNATVLLYVSVAEGGA
jgi:type VI secretion system protein ImpJ